MALVKATITRNPSSNSLVEQWLSRYALATPLPSWKQAPAGQAPDIAFRAVATDDRLLFSAEGKIAQVLARQAEKVAWSIKDAGGKTSPGLYAVSDVVLGRIHNFKAMSKSDAGGQEPMSGEDLTLAPNRTASDQQLLLVREVEAIFSNGKGLYPQFSDAAGRVIAASVLQFGARGLAKLKQPVDNNFAVVGARFAARSRSHGAGARGMPKDQCYQAIRIVEEWGVASGQRLLNVSLEGVIGTFADRAHSLAYDALACLDLAADLGSEARPGFRAWETAAEAHCYAVVALKPEVILAMDYEKAKAVAGSAIRHARGLMDNVPDIMPPTVPDFVEMKSPNVIHSMAMRLYSGGLPARRSEIAAAALVAGNSPASR